MTTASLEREVQELEAELQRSQGYLDAARKEKHVLVEIVDAVMSNRSLTKGVEDRQPAAEAAERGFATLKGVSKWKPTTLNGSELSFHYIGPCPKACIALSFKMASPASVKCIATVQPKLFQNHGSLRVKQLATAFLFLQNRVAALCDAVCQQHLHSRHEIGPLLRRLEWQLGRLERTTVELTMLKRRYHASLTPVQLAGSSIFQLDIRFFGQSDVEKLRATFEISEAYPFCPLNVCLDTFEEQLDVEAMRKLLIKNAKPGFGYLLRTCDVIAAFLH